MTAINVTASKAKMIFVFGSNEAGIHGAGAARDALLHHGAIYGKGYGHYGDSFAIPTKDYNVQKLCSNRIRAYIAGFLAYCWGHPKLKFKVTQIGCGLAGHTPQEMIKLFDECEMKIPSNVYFDEAWKPFLEPVGARNLIYNYWGTF